MKPIVLCIMDGWGLSAKEKGNSPILAKTPNLDYLFKYCPSSTLEASGHAVGLPDGQMGNSEVGHINLGAGRIVFTGLSLINETIKTNTLKDKLEIKEIFDNVKKHKSSLHIMTLASYGGVHSHLNHFFHLAEICKSYKQPYFVHLFTDGRDVDPKQSSKDIKDVISCVSKTDGTIGVISGRYYAMDRDKNWDRVTKVYDYLIGLNKTETFECPISYIESSYDKKITDEFILPAINKNALNATIKENDVVVFLNYRPDRAKQLSHLLVGSKNLYDYNSHTQIKNINLYSLMEYEKISVKKTIFPPFDIKNTLGEVLAKNNKSQLRIAETEKYPHVTHFFDGGKGVDYPKMKKILIPSPKVATYDLKPEMSTFEITDALLPELKNQDVVILNFANPDMVGHTGSLEATIKACESVDIQIGRIYEEIKKLEGVMLIIADHGNSEMMITEDNKPHTAHTTNLVPIIISNTKFKLKDGGKLGDIAPTILDLLNIKKPVEMGGISLIEK